MNLRELIIINCVELALSDFNEFQEKTNFEISHEELKTLLKLLWLEQDINKLKKQFEVEE